MKTREEILAKINEYKAEIDRLNVMKKNTDVVALYAHYQDGIIKLSNQALSLYWVLDLDK